MVRRTEGGEPRWRRAISRLGARLRDTSAIGRLQRGASQALILRGASIGLLFVMHFVLARLLAPADYGAVTFTLATAGIIAILAPLGWPIALSRFVAQYRAAEEWTSLRGILVRAHQVTLSLSVAAAAALWLASRWLELAPAMTSNLRFAAVLIPILSLVKLRRHSLQGLEDIRGMLIPEDVVLPCLVAAGALALAVATARGALGVYVASAIVAFVLGSSWLHRSLPQGVRTARSSFRTRAWMGVALPMLFTQVSQYVMGRTDVLVLGLFREMDSVGLFSAANRFALLIAAPMLAVNVSAAPLLAASYHSGRLDEFASVVRRARLLSGTASLLLFLPMALRPAEFLALLGSEFPPASLLLQVLAVGQLVAGLCGPAGYTLVMSGRERVFAGIVAGSAVLNLAGHFLFIPRGGAIAAAVVTATTLSALNLGCVVAGHLLIPRSPR